MPVLVEFEVCVARPIRLKLRFLAFLASNFELEDFVLFTFEAFNENNHAFKL